MEGKMYIYFIVCVWVCACMCVWVWVGKTRKNYCRVPISIMGDSLYHCTSKMSTIAIEKQ